MKEKQKRARNNGGPTCDVKLGEQGKNCHNSDISAIHNKKNAEAHIGNLRRVMYSNNTYMHELKVTWGSYYTLRSLHLISCVVLF